MLAEVVLLSRLLGLMTGTRPVVAQVDPDVRVVELVLDGKRIATLQGEPWRAEVDFGVELMPHELTAIARDERGTEIGRDRQIVNLARPSAELGVMIARRKGKLVASVSWQHIAAQQPVKLTATLEGRVVGRDVANVIALAESDSTALRVLVVEAVFADGTTARNEVAFGGVYSEQVPAELTATIVREREAGRKDPACFVSGGTPVRAEAIETGEAAVLFIRSVNPSLAIRTLLPLETREKRLAEAQFMLLHTRMRFVWPVAADSREASLFSTSEDFDGARGVRWLLTRVTGPPAPPQRMIDAVAVAGSEILREPRRRAVVLVLGQEIDESRYAAPVVKRYLERIGVPLFVWSSTGPRPGSGWGAVEDVSTSARLRDATDRLRRALAEQRIAWLPLGPFDAVHVKTTSDCAWEPVAGKANP